MSGRMIAAAVYAAGLAVSAQAEPNPLRDAFFGDTHVHTSYSLDAYIAGTRLDPAMALEHAQGNPVELPDGTVLQSDRPLDFVVIADHAEYIGEMYSAINPDAPGHDNPDLENLRNLTDLHEKQQWFLNYVVVSNRSLTPQHPNFWAGPQTTRSAWQVNVDAANAANKPGEFSAMIGYEWSSARGGSNLHRIMVFRNENVPDQIVSYIDINEEERLWEWMQRQEEAGNKVLAIPHNSNASKGRMFPDTDNFGAPLDVDYARMRAQYEPLFEMVQAKGSSEVHRNFWPNDEFAGFENADSIQNFSDRTYSQRDFYRGGLAAGLKHQQQLGVNPFAYGVIGGTDTHNGIPGEGVEAEFTGSHGDEDGTVERRRDAGIMGWIAGPDISAGSIAAVWAVENTREAIFDAMMRKETFATSGPRMKLRMFGGVGLSDPSDPVAMVQEGYVLGTHMGGDLANAAAAPTFTLYAEKDPEGANLDRIQIIKGWVDKNGDLNERIIDAVWSGDRQVSVATGKLEPVGNTVNLETAEYTNDIGASILMGSWTDSQFNPLEGAFYYARVLEIPTPRWTTYDAVRAGLPLLEGVPATIQERAWGSPIFHRPGG